jgi:hypothetical protein
MEYGKTITRNSLRNILGMGFITLLMLVIFLAWGHLQGRSHEVTDLYLASCKGLEQGISSVLTTCISLF